VERATRSAVIVSVPLAEPVVSRHRETFDVAARWGVPAHVTVVSPFAPPSAIDSAAMERLRSALASVPRFRARWAATGWFRGEVLWLAPEPEERFRALTDAVTRAFPEYPPYEGEFGEVVPHLTVGHTGTPDQLREVESQVLPHLPIRMEVTAAELWCGSEAPGAWWRVAELPLG
jgi:2'-5' RNA ligase